MMQWVMMLHLKYKFIIEKSVNMYDEELINIIKNTLEIVCKLNNEKKDYIKYIIHICIALIVSFTIIICCFYLLYFTM